MAGFGALTGVLGQRAEQRTQGTADFAEVLPEVKAFFARMVPPGGALPTKR